MSKHYKCIKTTKVIGNIYRADIVETHTYRPWYFGFMFNKTKTRNIITAFVRGDKFTGSVNPIYFNSTRKLDENLTNAILHYFGPDVFLEEEENIFPESTNSTIGDVINTIRSNLIDLNDVDDLAFTGHVYDDVTSHGDTLLNDDSQNTYVHDYPGSDSYTDTDTNNN